MAKQEKFAFDYEEYLNEIFETTAILSWSTHYPAFTFAFYLNQLYNTQLERQDDIFLEQKEGQMKCIVYFGKDTIKHIAYILVDNSDNMMSPKKDKIFDKTLLIKGPDAFEIAQNIYDDLNAMAPTDVYLDNSETMRRLFLDSGILESALFDFSKPDDPKSTYFSDTQNEKTLRKRQKFMKEQRIFFSDILLAVDSLLPDFESE
ncbi:MAG: hypothetical protein J6Y98_07870 [Bacteroidales bacterium]|nr:hypothetical protein [Bacteroidales bacterium]MCR5192532.1 hypothetical protein [Bacteroidales bacterium]